MTRLMMAGWRPAETAFGPSREAKTIKGVSTG